MTNLTWIPAQDDFETTLSASWNGWTGSMSVFDVPSWTLPAWETTYVVVEPWTSNMQVAEIDWWSDIPKELHVVNVTIEKANWVNYSTNTHPANSVVRISNNYVFWKKIQEAINSKAETNIVWDFTFSWNDISTPTDQVNFEANWGSVTLATNWSMMLEDKNVWPLTLSQMINPPLSWSAIEVMSETDFQQITPVINTAYFRYDN